MPPTPHRRTTLGTLRPSEAFFLRRTRIREIALGHRVSDVRVLGFVLTGQDDADSDFDLLVETTAQTALMDIDAISLGLKSLLGIELDALTPMACRPALGSMCCVRRWRYETFVPSLL